MFSLVINIAKLIIHNSWGGRVGNDYFSFLLQKMKKNSGTGLPGSKLPW